MRNLISDVRYAARTLAKNPLFAAVAVLTLALGIGANTAIFTLLDQILLRLLPVKEPQQLVLLTMRGRHYGNNWGSNSISHPMYRDFQDHNQAFSGMFCRFGTDASVMGQGQAEPIPVELVSGSYFSVLGVTTAIGRPISPDDDRVPNGHPVVVLSYNYWQQRFGGDREILGKTISVNTHPYTIIGVAQQGFDGVVLGFSPKLFIPIMMESQILFTTQDMLKDRRSRWVNAFGRLKPGMSLKRAKASLQPIMHSMLEMEVQEPAFSRASAYDREQFLKCTIDVLPGSQGLSYVRRILTTPLWALMAATGMVLLIACANLANLLLVRATNRQKEIAVRLAMGARRTRIVAQLLVEALLLSALGGVAGLGVAYWGDRALKALYLPADSGGLNLATSPDLRILLFAFGVTLLSGLFFGLIPALQTTKPDIARTLKDETGSVVGGRHGRLRKALVVAQVALSLLLLIGAGLFLRSLGNLSTLGPGFPAERLIGFEIDPSLAGYNTSRTKAYYQQLTESLKTIPGVTSVGVAAMRILEDNEWDSGMTVEGFTPATPDGHPEPFMNQIGPGYFATLGVPIVAGRDFTLQDSGEVQTRPGTEPDSWESTTAIINETFARKYFAGQNPIGHHIGFGTDPGTKTPMEVIGVIKDIKYTNLRDEIPEQAFIPYLGSHYVTGMTVYLRTTAEPSQVMPVVRAKVRDLDASVPIAHMRTEEAQITKSLTTERMIASLSSVFGLLATLLATLGLYGVMAYAVAQRRREIGIRMALGADAGMVIWLVMRDVILLVAGGIVIGVPAAMALMRAVQSQLFGVTAADPMTLALSTAGLALIACAAGFLPAHRASRLDPMVALRYE